MSEEFFLIDDKEVVITTHMNVRCDGDNGPLGHPAEYLTLAKGGETMCGYCGRRYVLDGTPAAADIRERAIPSAA